jgi:F-type H+-transporting ATPase subunit gamma
MANQKEIRARIASTISTQQITKAMKLVSATKLRKATEAITRMRPYAEKLQGMLGNLQDSADDEKLAIYFQQKSEEKVLLVVLSSDRGLCGAFNANMFKKTRGLLETTYAEQHAKGNVTVLTIGKKAGELLSKMGPKYDKTFQASLGDISSSAMFEIGEYILEMFRGGEYDKVELVYNKFKNAATQFATVETLLPVAPNMDKSAASNNDYIFEPEKTIILQELVPRSIKTQLYKAVLDSQASEHGSRMVAMDKSTENAGEILKALKQEYNQARQAAITNEISEIVGGAAALQG